MKHQLLNILLLFFFSPPSYASQFDSMIAELESTVGRTLTATEYRELREEATPCLTSYKNIVSKTDQSTILICGRAELDLYIGGSFGGCIDPDFNRYYVASASAGLQAGFSLNVFTLLFRSYSGSSIEGNYVGGKIAGAIGRYGGSLGLFYRTDAKKEDDRIYWIGYLAGLHIDISGSWMHISRF